MKLEIVREFKNIKNVWLMFFHSEEHDLIGGVDGRSMAKFSLWRFSTGRKIADFRFEKYHLVDRIQRFGKWVFILEGKESKALHVVDLETYELRTLVTARGGGGGVFCIGDVGGRIFFSVAPVEVPVDEDPEFVTKSAYVFDRTNGEFSRVADLDSILTDLRISVIATDRCFGILKKGENDRYNLVSYALDERGLPTRNDPQEGVSSFNLMAGERVLAGYDRLSGGTKVLHIFDTRMKMLGKVDIAALGLPPADCDRCTILPVDSRPVPSGYLVSVEICKRNYDEINLDFQRGCRHLLLSGDLTELRWHRAVSHDQGECIPQNQRFGMFTGEHVVHSVMGRLEVISVATGEVTKIPLDHLALLPANGVCLAHYNIQCFCVKINPPAPSPLLFWVRSFGEALCCGRIVED